MPVYEYACGACGHQFEEWQKMSDAPVRTCPKCKKKKVERLISRTAFQLKGGGWYADLYSSSKAGSSGTSDKSEAGASSSDGGSKDGGKKESGASTTAAKADSGKADASSSKSDSGSSKSNAGTARGPKNPAKKTEPRAA